MEFLPRPCDNTIVIVPLTRSIRGQWWTNKHTERKQQRDITQGCGKLFRPKKRPLWKINQTRNILRLRVDRISYFSDVTAENLQEKSENWGKFEISMLERCLSGKQINLKILTNMQEAGILHDWLAVSSSSACLLAASANPQLEIIGRQCWRVGVGRGEEIDHPKLDF